MLFLFVNMLTTMQNAIVIWLYRRKSDLIMPARTLFGYCIAIAEMIYWSTYVINQIVVVVSLFTYLTKILSYIFLSAFCLFSIGGIASQWLQLAYVLDMLMSVRFPLRYHAWFNKTWKRIVCVIIWISAAVLSLTELAFKLKLSDAAKFQSEISSIDESTKLLHEQVGYAEK